MTPPLQQTSRGQLAAVVLALGLATLTFLLPLATAALLGTALVCFAAGAQTLQRTHGLEPGAFSAGFYLATLLILGAGGWQIVHRVRAWQAARRLRSAAADPDDAEALAPAPQAPDGTLAALRQPWLLLGAGLFLADAFLVRWEIRGKLDSPDGLLAAAILASMVWAQLLVAAIALWVTRALWRTLLGSARRSPYAAGLVTAFGLAIGVASVLGLRSLAADAAEVASRQRAVASLEQAPAADSALERVRLAFVAFADAKHGDPEERQQLVQEPAQAPAAADADEPAAPDTLPDTAALAPPTAPAPEVRPAAADEPAATADADADLPFIGSLTLGPPFAGCVDRLTQRTPDDDPIQREIARVMARYGVSAYDARVLVIETLVSVCMKKGEDREDLRRYLTRSISNAARNFLTRHLNQRRTCSIELVPVVDYPDDTSGWRYADEAEQRARRAFCDLSEIDQAIVQARVMQELTFGQIAEQIGLSEDGARKAFDRAVRRLREKFEKN